MELEAWITLAVVIATVGVLTTERISPAFAVLSAVIVLLVLRVIDDEQAFSGFANSAPITVAALYVLAAAVKKTGALESIVHRMLGGSEDRSDRSVLARVVLPTAAASSVLNNTPIVAMVAPGLLAWARRKGRTASLFLMPVSFAAILGGLLTLIGTSTNLVVSGLMESAGMDEIGMFEITKVGAPVAFVGALLLMLLTPVLLPERRPPSYGLGANTREFIVEMVVPHGSVIAGKSVAEAGLRNLEGVYLVELERKGEGITPVPPEQGLAAGDRLIFAGNVSQVLDLQRVPGLASAEEPHFGFSAGGAGQRMFEAVIGEDSPLNGTTLKDIGFRNRYGGAVLAIHRAGTRLKGKLGRVPLRPGDVLLVLAKRGFGRRWRDERDFLALAALEDDPPPQRKQAPIVGLLTLAMLIVVTTGLVDILEASLVVAMALVGLRILTPNEARNAVDLNVIVVIAASFGVGAAITESGLAEHVAAGFVSFAGRFGDVGLLMGVLIATALVTELVTNNAAAVLMFPIAVATASQAGLEPRGFAIAIALGASASFLSPIGYQTNTMVYGLGGYHFSDFARLGAPLTLTMFVIASFVIPWAWPLS